MLGGALGMLTACAAGGSEGDCFGSANEHSQSAGYRRGFGPEGTALAVLYPNGAVSALISMKWHAYSAGDYGPEVIKNYDLFTPTGGCFWDAPACRGNIYKSDAPSGGKFTTLKAIAKDTSGDGKISSNVSAECGWTSGVAFIGDCPGFTSGFFADTPVCNNGPQDLGASTAMTDGMAFAWYYATSQDPNNSNNNSPLRLQQLPFELQQDVYNSIQASDVRTEVVDGVPMRVIRLHITKVRIGGASYRPVNVFLDVYGEGGLTLRHDNPGSKLLAAWSANQIESLLKRGTAKIAGSIELNGGVTITTDMLPSNVTHTGASQMWVDTLRKFAGSRVSRGE